MSPLSSQLAKSKKTEIGTVFWTSGLMVFNMLDTLILTFRHYLYEGKGHSMVWAIVENLLVNWPFQFSFKKHSKGFRLVFA